MSIASTPATAKSFSALPPLAPGSCVSHGAVRSQAPAVTPRGTKAAWADLEDSSTEEKELVESGTEPIKQGGAANASTTHAESSAAASTSTAMGVTTFHDQEIAEKDSAIFELSNSWQASTNGASDIETPDDGILPSKGSINHEKGECIPCLFVNRTIGCQNGAACTFCHLLHKKKAKPRLCKDRRDRFQRRVEDIGKKLDAEPHILVVDPSWLEKMVHELPPSFEGNEALKSKLVAKLNQRAEQILATQGNLKNVNATSTLDVRDGHFSGLSTAEIRCRAGEAHVQDSSNGVPQSFLTGSRAGIRTKTSL